ncbi:MAG: hypothetical protein QOH89_2146 [Pseudonocardiales bacterium]|jgi:hypothetical protein|nr:hypothetical protein [Pseudonocardiales bacterium]
MSGRFGGLTTIVDALRLRDRLAHRPSVLSVPWSLAALFLVLAAVVGVLAAVWPGYRAARTPPLAAVATA